MKILITSNNAQPFFKTIVACRQAAMFIFVQFKVQSRLIFLQFESFLEQKMRLWNGISVTLFTVTNRRRLVVAVHTGQWLAS